MLFYSININETDLNIIKMQKTAKYNAKNSIK
jgi:hypothetical protein